MTALIRELKSFGALVSRGFRIFMRDKAGVFFSLLAPLIILMLYFLFLGDIQEDSVKTALEGIAYEEKTLRAFVDGWMIAGVVSVSCITVSFSAHSVTIADNENGTLADIKISPVKRMTVTMAYLATNFIITTAIVLIVLVVCLVYLAIVGWYLTVWNVLSAIGMTLLSALSAAMISTIICMFIKTAGVHSAITGILSAAIGFLMGAYMPVSIFPKAVQYIVLFVPASYSAGIFRNIFTDEALKALCSNAPNGLESGLRDGFTLNMDFFGTDIGASEMLGIFTATIFFAIAVYVGIMLVRTIRAK